MKTTKIHRLLPVPVRGQFAGFKKVLDNEFTAVPWNEHQLGHGKRSRTVCVMNVLFWAILTHVSIATASFVLRAMCLPAAAARTVQKWLEIPDTFDIESWVNNEIQVRFEELPGKFRRKLRRKGVLIVDFVLKPFYGKENTPGTRKGKAKASTVKFFGYLTADTWYRGQQVTIAVLPLPAGLSYFQAFKTLVQHVENYFKPKIILADGDFSSREMIKFLLDKNIDFVLRFKLYKKRKWMLEKEQFRLQNRGVGGSKHFRFPVKKNQPEFTVRCIPYRKQGQDRLLVTSPGSRFSPKEAVKLYHHRFAIETGYRDKNLFLIPSKSTDWRVRFFLFSFAVLLWNCWREWRWTTGQIHSTRERYMVERYLTVAVLFQLCAFFWLIKEFKKAHGVF